VATVCEGARSLTFAVLWMTANYDQV